MSRGRGFRSKGRHGDNKQGSTKWKRGPVARDDPFLLQEVLLCERDRIVENGNIRKRGDKVWGQLKEEHKLNSSAVSIYTFVICNRGPTGGILYELGLRKRSEVVPPATTLFVEDDDHSFSDSSFSSQNLDDSVNGDSISTATIMIPKKKWRILQPKTITYRREDNTRQTKSRNYDKLSPGIWGTVFAEQLQRERKGPCSWSFKDYYVAKTDRAQYYLIAKGSCKCGAVVIGTCPNPLGYDPYEEGLRLQIRITGVKNLEFHKNVRQRPISNRMAIGSRMITENLSASFIRKELAAEQMDLFDEESGLLPKLTTLRKAKSDLLSKQKLASNALYALKILKYSPSHRLSIQDIGDDPFFVHYCVPDQMRVYNTYAQQVYSRLIIDATGNVVEKLERPIGQSGHLFLYQGVVSLPGEHEGQIPVMQMVSERHTAPAITFWLSEWRRLGGYLPKEVVVDCSAAILSAVCQAFAKVGSTEAYIDMCFAYLQDKTARRPSVLIRLDIAHLVKMIVQWDCVKKMRKRAKAFYVRSVCLVITSSTLHDAESLLRDIFVIASSETEGISVSTGHETPCELSKIRLLQRIASVKESSLLDNVITESLNAAEEEDLDLLVLSLKDDYSSSLKVWLDNIFSESVSFANQTDDGDRDNIMYSLEFRKTFRLFCFKLPLWCQATARAMMSPYDRAVGAHVESYLNRLMKMGGRIDIFLQRHVELIKHTMVLASGLQFFHKSKTCKQCIAGNSPGCNIEQLCYICFSYVHDSPDCSAVQDGKRLCERCLSSEATHIVAMVNSWKPQTPSLIVPNTAIYCPACKVGSVPPEDGGHRCYKCRKPVHSLPGCSYPAENIDEGYGQSRICMKCCSPSTDRHIFLDKSSNPIPLKSSEGVTLTESVSPIMPQEWCHSCNKEILPLQETLLCMKCNGIIHIEEDCLQYVVVEAEMFVSCSACKANIELNTVENWRGKALQSKKRCEGYYLTPYPELSVLLENPFRSKMGVLQNGGSIEMKPVKVSGGVTISLNNTCGIDALAALFACSYCDSIKFRDAMDDFEKMNADATLISLVVSLARLGTCKETYKIRAEIVRECLQNECVDKGHGLILVDCAKPTSFLSWRLNLPPSTQDTNQCSSPYCPKKDRFTAQPYINTQIETLEKCGFKELHTAVIANLPDHMTRCEEIMSMVQIEEVPSEYISNYPNVDLTYSKHPLCAGKRVVNDRVAPTHLLINVTGKNAQGASLLFDVEVPINVDLQQLPQDLELFGNRFYLRGVIAFNPPATRSPNAVGHYYAYCRRIGGRWQRHDDLQDKIENIKKTTKAHVDLLLYTI